MSREIIINAAPEETRVVVLEAGRAAEILIDRPEDRSVAGNVYLGRVDRVLPGMQAAFVDVGLDRHAFLHVSDVDAAPVDLAAADDDVEEAEEISEAASLRRRALADRRIEELVGVGDEVVVQVSREPLGSKGARVTTNVTLAGRYLVLMPGSTHVGISKRIESETDREELRSLLEEIRGDENIGYIGRTSAAGASREEIEAEARWLGRRWRELQDRRRAAVPPACLHAEMPLALRAIRDSARDDLQRILVDDEDAHAEVQDFVRSRCPGLEGRVHRYEGTTGVFEALGLEQEVEKALRARVWLKSGGYLIINQLEALVAVDVNTGKYTGGKGLEETALRTNLEAAREVARQLRLRDLGGIVVIDFIDMVDPPHRQEVLDELNAGLARDRARTTVLGMSAFGLVEVTRQRQRRSLPRLLQQACPTCRGSGRLRSAGSVATAILRSARLAARRQPGTSLRARCHPEVAAALEALQARLSAEGRSLPVALEIVPDEGQARDAFQLSAAD